MAKPCSRKSSTSVSTRRTRPRHPALADGRRPEDVRSGKVKFSALHNFCPLPVEITRASPDCYKFSSPDERERERAVRLLIQTIDFAARLGAPFVVLHLGRSPDRRLHGQAHPHGGSRHAQFARLRARRSSMRFANARPGGPHFVQRATECLRRIAEHARKRACKLGVESRH